MNAASVVQLTTTFDPSNDEEFVARLGIPGLRRAGDLTTAACLSRGEVIVHDAGDRFSVPRLTIVKAPLTPREVVERAARSTR